VGILHLPGSAPSLGMIVVVGGPQYRVGSHRQFVLLARAIARRGVAVLRFDCRGMGDSDGTFRGFENIEPDIEAATAFMQRQLPGLRGLTLWGLCDATSAICLHARKNPAVRGVVLVNPWVRTEAGHARARLRHYYLARLREGRLLQRLLRGEIDVVGSATSLLRTVGRAMRPGRQSRNGASDGHVHNPLAERMATNLRAFDGRILVITSGQDLTAREFEDAARGSKAWRRLQANSRMSWHRIADADHTFSRPAWTDQVSEWTGQWAEIVRDA